MKESPKVMETKERIKDAFFELYKDQKIEKISIKEITDKAQLNRGTFYVYYKDIYDLLDQAEDEIIQELLAKLKGTIGLLLFQDHDNFSIKPALQLFIKHSKYLKILLGSNGDPNFTHKLKSIVIQSVKEMIEASPHAKKKNLDYIMEYVSSAQLGLLSYWLRKDMELDIDEFEVIMKRINLNGPLSYLRSED